MDNIKSMIFILKQLSKMLIQNSLLPLVYAFYARRPVQSDLILFASAHDEQIPFSMQCAYREAEKSGYEIKCMTVDYNKMSFMGILKSMTLFMKYYAAARYVFICDYFLPVSSCKKRPETTVVQLWHSGGVMKKMGYDTSEDIPAYYRGNMFGNYSLVSVSSEKCADVIASAMRLSRDRVRPLGLSRTDIYFDEDFQRQCRQEFYHKYPAAKGRKIVLWAPTFRGNAAAPELEGYEAVSRLFQRHSDEWYGVIKAHPHLDKVKQTSNCDMATERLLGIADLMITDFSSIMYDYLLFGKPCLLYVPDWDEYIINRGIYLEEQDIPFVIIKEEQKLEQQVMYWLSNYRAEMHNEARALYMKNCDGQATKRIFSAIGITKTND